MWGGYGCSCLGDNDKTQPSLSCHSKRPMCCQHRFWGSDTGFHLTSTPCQPPRNPHCKKRPSTVLDCHTNIWGWGQLSRKPTQKRRTNQADDPTGTNAATHIARSHNLLLRPPPHCFPWKALKHSLPRPHWERTHSAAHMTVQGRSACCTRHAF